MKQAALDFDLDPAEWPTRPAARPAPPAETPVLDRKGRRVGTVVHAGSADYPYVAACAACGARQTGWAQPVGAEMWTRHHAETRCPGLQHARR